MCLKNLILLRLKGGCQAQDEVAPKLITKISEPIQVLSVSLI
jgi:hypothetical protein